MQYKGQPYDPVAESGGGGYYQMALKSGLLPAALAAGDTLFSFYWNPVVPDGRIARCQLKFIKVNAITTTAFGTAQLIEFDTFCAKAWSGADSGGSRIIPAAGDQKRQKRYADSLFLTGGDIRIATTAALTKGTRTLEAQPFSSFGYWSGAIGAGITPPIIEEWDDHHVPMVFEPGQGFVIDNAILFGATGVVRLWVDLMWMEEYETIPGW